MINESVTAWKMSQCDFAAKGVRRFAFSNHLSKSTGVTIGCATNSDGRDENVGRKNLKSAAEINGAIIKWKTISDVM